MLTFLPGWLRIALAFLLLVLNTIVHVLPLLLLALLKLLLPLKPVRDRLSLTLIAIAESWIGFNGGILSLFTRTRIEVRGGAELNPQGAYLVLCNHQSWVDIPVLQSVMNRQAPFMRFFLKRQLIWVPLLGLAWWALDFPFMTRQRRARDLEATRRACERYRGLPVSVMNFVEGTRFTEAKHKAQRSPYRHLLKPKSGGVVFVLQAMGDVLDAVIDITIHYPGGRPTMVDLLGNRVSEVLVQIRRLPVPLDLVQGDYDRDRAFRQRCQDWIGAIWSDKDATLDQLEPSASAAHTTSPPTPSEPA